MARLNLALILGLGLSSLTSSALAQTSRIHKHRLLLPETLESPPIAKHQLIQRQQNEAATDEEAVAIKLLIGGGPSGTIATANFDGKSFTILANNTMPGTSASWLLPRCGRNGDVYAVDEFGSNTRLFRINPPAGDGDSAAAVETISLVQNATGSSGVVYLEFGAGQTRVVGSAYGNGTIDVWDTSAADGSLKFMKQIVPGGELGPNRLRQEASHPHQAILDPTTRFFVANDLGTDTILVIDAEGDAFEITSRIRVDPAGCGPRHGVFYPPKGLATHYILVCEMLRLVQVYNVAYTGGKLQMSQSQSLDTFPPDSPPKNMTTASAGEIQVSPDGHDIYVSNRGSGSETDNVSHFAVKVSGGKLTLEFKDSISSGGILPRMFSLESGTGRFVFLTNQDGELGLVAFKRNADGSLGPKPVASLPRSLFGMPEYGPQFVQQI